VLRHRKKRPGLDPGSIFFANASFGGLTNLHNGLASKVPLGLKSLKVADSHNQSTLRDLM